MKTKKILFMYFLLVLSKVSKRRMWSFIHSFKSDTALDHVNTAHLQM